MQGWLPCPRSMPPQRTLSRQARPPKGTKTVPKASGSGRKNGFSHLNGLLLRWLVAFFLDELLEQVFTSGGRGVRIGNHKTIANGTNGEAQERSDNQVSRSRKDFAIDEQAGSRREAFAKELDGVVRDLVLRFHVEDSTACIITLVPVWQQEQGVSGAMSKAK